MMLKIKYILEIYLEGINLVVVYQLGIAIALLACIVSGTYYLISSLLTTKWYFCILKSMLILSKKV